MYSPEHYNEKRIELIENVISKYSFATMITLDTKGPMISHLPLIFDYDSNKTLVGHCARANPQWKHFSENQVVTAIFQGPHAYITPAWYSPSPDNVPTWNYVSVHVKGHATLVEDVNTSYEILKKITQKFESLYATNWALPASPNEELRQLLNGIVTFRLQISDVQAKFKLSQKLDSMDRSNVISNLSELGEQYADLAQFMMRTSSEL